MNKLACLSLLLLVNFVAKSQTNSFPLYSSGAYTAGSLADGTDATNCQLKLSASSGFLRIPHLSASSTTSAVFNFQTNKSVYWGETTDVGQYAFRGRDFLVTEGKVGIGTSTPLVPLQVNSTIANITRFQYNGDTNYPRLNVIGSPNKIMLQLDASSTTSTDLSFGTQWLNDVMTIKGSGNVGIGTSIPDQKLTVKGIIHAQEVRVDLSVPGPDYVFNANYKLPTLKEIKSYIDKNKHLPEVPTAAAMEKNGIQVGEMNMILLKKVEELTLYIIEQEKRIAALENKTEK